MFSIFRSKKSPPPSPIPGPDTSPESDNFVMIDDRNNLQPNSTTGLYPLFDASTNSGSGSGHNEMQPVHYLQGVPFKLSPEISEGDSTQVYQMQVDEILAKLTRWNSVEEDYDFMLERSLVAQ